MFVGTRGALAIGRKGAKLRSRCRLAHEVVTTSMTERRRTRVGVTRLVLQAHSFSPRLTAVTSVTGP